MRTPNQALTRRPSQVVFGDEVFACEQQVTELLNILASWEPSTDAGHDDLLLIPPERRRRVLRGTHALVGLKTEASLWLALNSLMCAGKLISRLPPQATSGSQIIPTFVAAGLPAPALKAEAVQPQSHSPTYGPLVSDDELRRAIKTF